MSLSVISLRFCFKHVHLTFLPFLYICDKCEKVQHMFDMVVSSWTLHRGPFYNLLAVSLILCDTAVHSHERHTNARCQLFTMKSSSHHL